MTTATIKAFVENAKLIAEQKDSMYIALGRKSPWNNENMPPVPEETVENLDEVIGYKKPDTVSLCRPLKDGETTGYPTADYKGFTWVLVPPEDAQAEEAYHIYLNARILPEDMPLGEYRQEGVYINIDSEEDTLVPGDYGLTNRVLYFYDNNQRFNRTERVTTTVSFVINTRNTD